MRFRSQPNSVKKFIFFKTLTDVHMIVNDGFIKLKRYSFWRHFGCTRAGTGAFAQRRVGTGSSCCGASHGRDPVQRRSDGPIAPAAM
jgi:hypothetical protein